MRSRTIAVLRRTALALACVAAATSPAAGQVNFTFYESFPSTAPDPNQPFPGGNVFCTASAAGTATGFSFNFGDAATRALLCPSDPARLNPGNQLFGARITGALNAPSAGTYSVFLNVDDGDRLTVNGSIVRTDWVIKASGPGNIGNIALVQGLNPFILDYFQGAPVAGFATFTVSGGLTVTPPTTGGGSVVPEPQSVALLATGLVLVAGACVRRRSA